MLRVDVYEGGDEAGEGVEESYPNTRKEKYISNLSPFLFFSFRNNCQKSQEKSAAKKQKQK